MFSWFLDSVQPWLWLCLAFLWTLIWLRPGESLSNRLVTFALGLVATLPMQAMMLQFLTVDAASIAQDLLGRYPLASVNFGGFKVTYLLLRPLVAILQTVTEWSDDTLLKLMKAAHALLGAGIFALSFRLLPHEPSQRRLMQIVACLGFLIPSVFFANKILNYDSVSNALALLSAIACGRYGMTQDRYWARLAFLAAALGFAEKVTVLPFLVLALAALGWSIEDRGWRTLWRAYLLSLATIVAPAVLVIAQLWLLSSGGSLGKAVADSFRGLLFWTLPLRNLPGLRQLLTPLWVQALLSFCVVAVLILAPGWPPLRVRIQAWVANWAKCNDEAKVIRALGLMIGTVVILGLLAPHLISPKWMAVHNIAPGVVTTTPLNGSCITYEATNPVTHLASCFLNCCWQMVEWWPSVVCLLVALPFVTRTGGGRPMGAWLIVCGLGYLIFFVLTRNPIGHRYIAPAGICLAVGLLSWLAGVLATLPSRSMYAGLATLIALTLLDLGRYWPCVGAFRPVVMSYPVDEIPKFGDAKAPWMGWGEEVALAAHLLQERGGDEESRLYILYGQLLGFPDVECRTLKVDPRSLQEPRPFDLVIINRGIRILRPIASAEPVFAIKQGGWTVAWVYRVGDVFAEAE